MCVPDASGHIPMGVGSYSRVSSISTFSRGSSFPWMHVPMYGCAFIFISELIYMAVAYPTLHKALAKSLFVKRMLFPLRCPKMQQN